MRERTLKKKEKDDDIRSHYIQGMIFVFVFPFHMTERTQLLNSE
jgi:hypothetical protein